MTSVTYTCLCLWIVRYCPENLMFWLDAENFSTLPDSVYMRRIAFRIFAKYIDLEVWRLTCICQSINHLSCLIYRFYRLLAKWISQVGPAVKCWKSCQRLIRSYSKRWVTVLRKSDTATDCCTVALLHCCTVALFGWCKSVSVLAITVFLLFQQCISVYMVCSDLL